MAKRKLKRINSNFSSNYDPNGSYTGNTNNKEYEKPVQDADDL